MNRIVTAVAVLAGSTMLAACSKEPAAPRTADEVIAEAGKLEQPRPGRYETTVDLIDFSVPGIPQEQANAMKSMMGRASQEASSYCLTEAEAAKGFEESVRKMTEGQGQMKCEFGRFAVDGGKLDAALTCSGPQGMTADIALDGTASAEASTMHMTMVQKAAMMPGGQMRVEMRMNSKRTGDCE
ncbi:DUF3617 domain-containing protein [Tsuneonella sp. YG55]|uniref:DUF3617 domain-containing protein n=1 Tax=Tsuneonella litorea TaxID=2976475 RepID=A0A9X2W263_9SPHN|nr:DUF3617 domain-containing protein [Tsuneonella litorea]MCT2559184.1 DUF3617 domain-containing protein [Tsuneonella litorea]